MKVVRVINSLGFGGIEKVYEIVAKYYTGNKEDLIFVALGFGGNAAEYIQSLGFKVIILNKKTRIPNVQLLQTLVKLFKQERPDVVHTCGAEGNFHGLLAAWWTGVPVRIGEEIGMPSHSSMAKRIFRFVYSRSTYAIAVAKAVQKYMVAAKEVKPANIKLVYNPVDMDHYIQTLRTPDPGFITLITVCRLHPIKNLDSLILCVKELKASYPSLRLWMVGEGDIRETLQSMVDQLGLRDTVTFLGFQSDPRTFLAKADFFVLPSHSEGHPVSLVEAMIAGVPALVTKVGGASEILVHGENGWLLDPKDLTQMKQCFMEAFATTAPQRTQITNAARAYAIQYFSPANYFKELAKLYRHEQA